MKKFDDLSTDEKLADLKFNNAILLSLLCLNFLLDFFR